MSLTRLCNAHYIDYGDPCPMCTIDKLEAALAKARVFIESNTQTEVHENMTLERLLGITKTKRHAESTLAEIDKIMKGK